MNEIPNWILSLSISALFSFGILIGKYLDNVENLELNQKISLLEKQIEMSKEKTNFKKLKLAK